MPDNLKFTELKQQTIAYLLDRGLAVLILWAVYNIATTMGASWINTQEKLINELHAEREQTDARWKVMVQMARDDDKADAEFLERFIEAIEAVEDQTQNP